MARKVDPKISKYFSKKGKKGGKARWQGKSEKERSEHGRMMWSKRGKKRLSTHSA